MRVYNFMHERERGGGGGGASNPDVYLKTPSGHNVIQVSAGFGGGGEGEGRGRGVKKKKKIGDVFRSSTWGWFWTMSVRHCFRRSLCAGGPPAGFHPYWLSWERHDSISCNTLLLHALLQPVWETLTWHGWCLERRLGARGRYHPALRSSGML